MKPVDPSSPCFGLVNLPSSRSGLVLGLAVEVVVEMPKSPKTILRANLRFSRGVKVGIGYSARAMVKAIPEEELLNNDIKLFCWGLVLTQLGADA